MFSVESKHKHWRTIMAISNDIIDQLIGKAKTEEDVFGKDGLLKQLTKQITERILESELTHELGYEKHCKNNE